MAHTAKKSATRKQAPIARAKRASRRRPARRALVLVATRKGAWLFHGDAARKTWRIDGPHFLGQIVNHLVLGLRDGQTLLAAAKTGHLGPTVFRLSPAMAETAGNVSTPTCLRVRRGGR